MEKKYKEALVISDNITLFKEDFGPAHFSEIRELLRHVDIWLTDAIGQPHFSSKKIIVIYREQGPMCSDLGIAHLINISAQQDYWCQWMYQFAHEYCHHLIDGPLDGDMKGLSWFEETICHLSSFYCLSKMVDYCYECTTTDFWRFGHMAHDFLSKLLAGCVQDMAPLHLYIEKHLPELCQQEYHRNIYNHIAFVILPLFLRNPSLWKIILHFGNMNEWKSLNLLFEHLISVADTTYLEHLKKLRKLLLGS